MKNHQESLFQRLQDDAYAAGYLEAAWDEGVPEFHLAIRDVMEARAFNKTKVAEEVGICRESLYKILSKEANPYTQNTKELLKAIGFHVKFEKAPV